MHMLTNSLSSFSFKSFSHGSKRSIRPIHSRAWLATSLLQFPHLYWKCSTRTASESTFTTTRQAQCMRTDTHTMPQHQARRRFSIHTLRGSHSSASS